MLLADMGAEVIRIDRPAGAQIGVDVPPEYDLLNRSRRSVAIDLKHPDGARTALRLISRADALIEGFRPGVAERLGLGPDPCLAANPRLVYGRMTGWGQTGPLAHTAGHDINFVALSGALHAIGTRAGGPVPPLNLVGDFGGGALYLAMGVCAALLEAHRSGRGQVIDAAMTDGAASLTTFQHGLMAGARWHDQLEDNLLDGAAPFYRCYATRDERWMAVGALEPKFYDALLRALDIDPASLPPQEDRASWPVIQARFAAVFRTKTREEWCRLLDGHDVCVAPVLSLGEAAGHAHNRARGTFVEAGGIVQPAPAPRFSRTPGAVQGPPARPGAHTRDVLLDWGFDPSEIDRLRAGSAIV